MSFVLTTYPIADAAEDQYKGSGHAFAAIKDGEVVAIRYIRDLDEHFEGEGMHAEIDESLPAIADGRRDLADIGDVEFGMCSSWEFVVFP